MRSSTRPARTTGTARPPRRRGDRGAVRPFAFVLTAVAVIAVVAAVTWYATGGHRNADRPATAARTAVPPEPAVVGQSANGRTLTLRTGQTLRVVLGSPTAAGSTSWSFAPLGSGVLSPLGTPTVTPDRSDGNCGRPGMGCGTVALTLTAQATGTTEVSASRTSCGEAIRCAAGQDRFHVTVVVAG